MKIGMLTSGGDCQGLNSALRGVAKTLYNELGSKVTIYGIRDGYRGLIEGDYHEMSPRGFFRYPDRWAARFSAHPASRSSRCRRSSEDSEETKLQKMLKTVAGRGLSTAWLSSAATARTRPPTSSARTASTS